MESRSRGGEGVRGGGLRVSITENQPREALRSVTRRSPMTDARQELAASDLPIRKRLLVVLDLFNINDINFSIRPTLVFK